MRQNNQDYITIASDGSVVPKEHVHHGVAPRASADVAYRLARIAEEVSSAAPVRPVSFDTASQTFQQQEAPCRHAAKGGLRVPVALVMARAKAAKRLFQQVAEAGLAPYGVYTQDHRFEAQLKTAEGSVCLGEHYSDALFCNAYAVLQAAASCQASVILLCDEALPLARVDSFLARASDFGIRVFRPLNEKGPLLDWVLCTTDKKMPEASRWRTCPHCKLMFDEVSLAAGHYVCPSCGGYFRMSSNERINDLLDADSFVEWDDVMAQVDPLNFPGYVEKLEKQRDKTGLHDAICTGEGRIAGLPVAVGFMDSQFFMGSMGSVVGEKVTRLITRATDEHRPVIIFTASGGARMQEGIVSLMQMAKVSCAVQRHGRAGLPYFSVLTDPTTGGVTASFAMQGDVVLAEPKALIGFAGQRVIKDTIRQELPEGFQTAEFALEHGLIDAVVKRDELRGCLAHLLALHMAHGAHTKPLVGEREILLNYAAVQDNLEHGNNTYNAVTFGDVVAGALDSSAKPVWDLLGLRKHFANVTQQWEKRSLPSRRRLEKAFEGGGLDAEVASSILAVDTTSTKGDQAQAAASKNVAWESVQLARNTHRPTAQAYLNAFVDGFIELHGDRSFGDDGAIVCGLGWVGTHAVTIIAQEKGADLKERIKRNFGCPQPEGYRKTLRLMRQAEKFGRPVVCLVDTQGAYCGMEAEERGQGNAIAENLLALAGLRVPVISVLLGEGGSGGALALALADRVAMQEHAVYSVLSPEGFASILWKDRTRAPEAAAVMKMSAREAEAMGVVDSVISEGPKPAHENPEIASRNVRRYVLSVLDDLAGKPVEDLLSERHRRFERF